MAKTPKKKRAAKKTEAEKVGKKKANARITANRKLQGKVKRSESP